MLRKFLVTTWRSITSNLKDRRTDKQLKAFAGSKAIAVNPNCKYQQVAVALAKYLGGKDAQQSHYELRGVIPCNTELLATDAIKNDALITAQNDTFNKTSVSSQQYQE